MEDSKSERGCEECPLAGSVERRDFVRDVLVRGGALFAAGAFSMFGGVSLPVRFGAGVGRRDEKSYALPADDGAVIDKDESVIIARFAGRAYAFSLACPHQNTAIRWEARNHRFQCPKHKSRYQPDGVFIEGRATRGLDRFAVRLDRANLLVNLDLLYREDENPKEWASAFVTLAPASGG